MTQTHSEPNTIPAGEKSFFIGAHRYDAPPLEAGLYLVATPIGNLGDMTLRGLEVLAAADIIACEDTRTSRILLSHYGIKAKTLPYHEHNAAAAGAHLLRLLQEGGSVALISDAGTPLLSDPGYPLAQAAAAQGIAVIPLPGASALLAALTACGLPTDSFYFGGFLPPKQSARRTALQAAQGLPCTLIFYESPRRAAACLSDMAEILGGARPACLCRELTKKFETFDRAPLAELAARYGANPALKGEIVLAVGKAESAPKAMPQAEQDALLLELAEQMPPARAAAAAAQQTGGKKQALYARLLALKNR